MTQRSWRRGVHKLDPSQALKQSWGGVGQVGSIFPLPAPLLTAVVE